jgi:hypothetical protein
VNVTNLFEARDSGLREGLFLGVLNWPVITFRYKEYDSDSTDKVKAF